jgi:hypothetical protein
VSIDLTTGIRGSLLICDWAFTTKILPETDLPETILHEIACLWSGPSTMGYCDRATGFGLLSGYGTPAFLTANPLRVSPGGKR